MDHGTFKPASSSSFNFRTSTENFAARSEIRRSASSLVENLGSNHGIEVNPRWSRESNFSDAKSHLSSLDEDAKTLSELLSRDSQSSEGAKVSTSDAVNKTDYKSQSAALAHRKMNIQKRIQSDMSNSIPSSNVIERGNLKGSQSADMRDLDAGSIEISRRASTNFPPPKERVRKKSRHGSRGLDLDSPRASGGDDRVIYINDPRLTNEKCEFTGNEIRTSKYTIITFLPINLFLQFHRVAYIYFLAIACLNQLPWLAVFGRTVSLFPLLFVLSVTAVKDGYEDWRRHRSDRKENNRMVDVLHRREFQPKKWKNLEVGDVLRVKADETIPCDMVLLNTSDLGGIAYVQTINLDGESNLKTRYARQETAMRNPEKELPYGVVRCEKPNRNIYGFIATMEIDEKKIPLGPSNILLRGCQLKNTAWAVGVAVYAGQETKAMQNSSGAPSKRSKLESLMNRETLWLSVFLFIMCAVVAVGMCLWLVQRQKELSTTPFFRKRYFTIGKDNGKKYHFYGSIAELFISFLSSVIVFQIMIPISLYITMELVRLGQSYFMIGDKEMYDVESDSRFQCRSLNINEDLGQIRYIFSDKTGTLTQNKMEFCKATVNGANYTNARLRAESVGSDSNFREADNISDLDKRTVWKPKIQVKVDPELALLLNKNPAYERAVVHDYFLTLAACNTIVPIKKEEEGVIEYQGESPDEQALVSAAAAYGYILLERTSGYIVIDILGEKQRFDVLGLHEFDSVRKRMSVVVRCQDSTVKALVKGADTSMFGLFLQTSNNGSLTAVQSHNIVRYATEKHLQEYAMQGLRTLVLGSRTLSDDELERWQNAYDDASTALIDRAMLLRGAASHIECNLNLLGATGIEDKLQDGVPETIESLREAGIKVWVLTGDKQETAISIGLSCKLITQEMQYIIINGNSKESCQQLLAEAKTKYTMPNSRMSGDALQRETSIDSSQSESIQGSPLLQESSVRVGLQAMGHISDCDNISKIPEFRRPTEHNTPLALIIDGSSLVYILDSESEATNHLEQELFDLATSCNVVLCCRVAPLQKAGIVNLIKSRTNDMTLAIGDGANDVSMIQMADVGVGVSGQEGRQAVMAADFAMGQFKFLKRLLLVHGHWNYQRIAYLVLYNFYRNAVFVLMLFWYILCTAFSATSALTDWSSVFYSVIYTSVPTIVVGILDKDLSHKTLLRYPKLYCTGQRHEAYNLQLFWLTMADTLWQSLVLFYVPVFTFQHTTIDIWSMGSLWTIAVVVLVNVHLMMDIQRWVFFTHAAIWGSIAVTYVCLFVLDSFPTLPNYMATHHLVKSSSYWLNLFLIILIALLPRFLFKIMMQRFWPSDIQIAREEEILKRSSGCSHVKLTEAKHTVGS